MKTNLVVFTLAAMFVASVGFAQKKPDPTLRSILLEQLKTTHDVKDWFVPVNIALADMTPEQANWTDGKGNHSVAQLATHLIFWNETLLAKFKGTKPPEYNGNNAETFSPVDKDSWPATLKKIDGIMKEWEKIVETADEATLKGWYSTIAHIGAHNAYHIGQILYVRKLQGSWDPEKGVK